MKKWMLVLMACFVFAAFSAPHDADAARKPSGGYKSGNKPYAPTKPSDNVSKTEPGKTTTTPGSTTTAPKTGGLFGGGGFMKGLMLGGLAGMLFGGLFGNMGFLGSILGLLINVMAIFFLIVLIRSAYVYFKNRRKPKNQNRYQE